ncbi:uncharacterized protein [Palaemon carinicauda]|uniref:uncharacterized protein n=1 Tax=Palaemon carinicauda TaxID=392227 RepID=UPI0035B61502
MATNKIAMKFRSITYPNHDSPTHSSNRGKLQRMKSFDFSHSETCTTTTRPAMVNRREVSAEGRMRTRHFQHTHSASHSSNTLAPGQKLLRFSDECWCTPPPIEHGGRQARSVGCLTSPKSRPGSAIRLGATGSSSSSSPVERLVDWQRESGIERHSLSPSHSYERFSRQSRSRERRLEKDSSSSSSCERRSHLSSSASLLQSSKSSSVDVTTPTNAPVSSEGRSRRSQFRRAWSLFSLTCDKEVERERREKSPQQRILRPPTRHVYRRGLSGLPIECSSRYLGLAY